MAGYTNSQQVDAQSVGRTSTGLPWIDTRDPTPNDIYYSIGQFWINRGSARLWYLNAQSNASGSLQSTWELISVSSLLVSISDTGNTPVFPSSNAASPPDNIQLVGGTGITVVSSPGSNLLTISNTGSGTETLTGDDGVIVSPILGTIQTLGNVVANSTHAKPLFTQNPSTNIEQWDIQVGAAIASTNINKAGLAAFSNAQFAVDANGFVTLAGGSGAPTLGIVPDAHTAPGTTPVVPNGSGNITLEGGITFATGTQANPIRTNSLAANTIDLQIQLSGSNAATSTANKFGVAQFDANSFTVTSGFVTLNGGGTTGAITKVAVDANTGPGTNPVLPSVGQITVTGAQIAAGSTTNVIRTDSLAANTYTIQIQRSQAVASTTIGDNGVSHFSSSQFAVDANGFVTLAGGTTAGILTLTGNSGGAISPSSGNINTLGTGSITISGSGSTLTTQLTGLTNHAVLVGAGTATITNIAATSNTGAILQNNSGADPSYSTATYPSTTTINQILYSSATNTVAGLATTNSSSLVTSASGVPTWLGPMTNGQMIIGSTGAIPVSTTLTAGSGITITNGAGSITIASSNGSAVVGLTPDSTTGGGTSPVVPNGSGDIIVTSGANYNTGTGTNSVRTVSTAANTLAIELQLAGANATTSTPNNFGVAQFNSNQFGVTAGYVSSNNFTITAGAGLSGGGTITLGGSVTLTATGAGFVWTDEAISFNAASNNGYFCTAVLTVTLPASPSQGDVIRVVCDTTSVVTIQANTGQFIRLGNVISASAGTAASTRRGDAINIVYRAATGVWFAFEGTVGTWGLT